MSRDRSSASPHRRIAAATLGRPIAPGHDIDHLNENKADNSPGNLAEVPHGAHSRTTQSAARKGLRTLQRALTMVTRREKHY